MKLKKSDFRKLSNKERAELYDDLKSHDEIYLGSDISIRKKIHLRRFNTLHRFMENVPNKKILDAEREKDIF